MLLELRIKNFAIIESLDFSFSPGMNVLTGETGAGKSIIIQAVNLILGDRASSGLVRSGEKEASVEAAFSLTGDEALKKRLADLGIASEDELIIRRVISQEGKNRVFINGSLATLGMLSDVAENLVSISSQHEHQTLLRADNHLLLLDSYGKLGGSREKYAAAYRRWKTLKRELHQVRSAEKNQSERLGLLTFQRDEIVSARIEPDEDVRLREERNILLNAEKLSSCAAQGEDLIYASENSLVAGLSSVITRVRECALIDSQLEETAGTLENILFQLEDAAMTLRDYGGRIEPDPLRLNAVEDRLIHLEKLLKKYGPTVTDIMSSLEQIEADLEALESGEAAAGDLEARMEAAWAEAGALAGELSAERKRAADRLSRTMAQELQALGMKSAAFEVRVAPLMERGLAEEGALNEWGQDDVGFHLSTNPGEAPKPLAAIASGGELSRIMLALKGCILGEGKMPTLIFDEVDSGIGGGTAEVVGRKIKAVSKGAHVICITHLPQIAALGDAHFRVEKNVRGGRTYTTIARLDDDQRVEEVARMLGGVEITKKTREHATEMLTRNA